MKKNTVFILLTVVALLSTSGIASAYYYSDWGNTVRPVGANRYLQAARALVEPGLGLTYGFQAFWRSNSTNTVTSSPGGNTWARAGGYCNNGATWVDSGWKAPSSNANTATVTVYCPVTADAYEFDAYAMVASDGYSSFTY